MQAKKSLEKEERKHNFRKIDLFTGFNRMVDVFCLGYFRLQRRKTYLGDLTEREFIMKISRELGTFSAFEYRNNGKVFRILDQF